jgi:hypothetical protein
MPEISLPGVLAVAAGLLQATSLPFIVAATDIGAALVVAGLLSVVLLPLGALTLLRAEGMKPGTG